MNTTFKTMIVLLVGTILNQTVFIRAETIQEKINAKLPQQNTAQKPPDPNQPKPQEPSPRTYKITNNTTTPAQVYLTAAGYSYVAKGSKGNLAYDTTGTLDPEGEYRTVQPNETTTYTFKEGSRMGFCIQAVMVKFQDQTDPIKAIQKNNDYKGCPNQNIIITREDDSGNQSPTGAAVATFNYTAPKDPAPAQ